MSNTTTCTRFIILSVILAFSSYTSTVAQHLLNKIVTVEARKKPVSEVLESIGRQGDFYFSYNTNLVKQDSIVTIYAYRKTVKEVLDMLFDGKFEYKEKSRYIIIQQVEYWHVSGYVTNGLTGEKIPFASVYDKQQMVSTLTNEDGYFRLKLKNTGQPVVINVNRSWYADTSIVISNAVDKELSVSITPKSFMLDTLVVTQYSGIEKNWFSRLFLSSRQRIQALNINKYFVDMPYQTSITPGLSTHGSLNSQVVNKISFNVLGGYTAGTDGVELGGLFNIVRKDVKYVQVAGLFNNVGGEVEGVQISGIFNNILDSVNAVQVAGVTNVVQGAAKGVQVAGVNNYSNHEVNGTQVAGVANIAGTDVNGVQIAGVVNIVRRTINGGQISGVLNIAETLNGFQIGIVNIADSSNGFSIGLLPLVRKNGYNKISLSSNEVINSNIELILGTRKLHNIFLAGLNIGPEQAFTFGMGIGGEIKLWKWISLNPQATCQHIYLGDWRHANLLSKAYLNLNIRINKYLAIYGGPTLNIFYNEQDVLNEGYKSDIPGNGYSPAIYTDNISSWIGWNAGITFL